MLMDEPFGAIDPINRERLQNEFLRLQAELRKTIVFVTHDIDEAIKMGDKIAILKEGGHPRPVRGPGRAADVPGRAVRRGLRGRRPRAQAARAAARPRHRPVEGRRSCGSASRWPRPRKLADADLDIPLLVDDNGRPLGWLSERGLQGERVREELRSPAEPVVELDDILRDALSDLLAADSQYGPVVDADGARRRRAVDRGALPRAEPAGGACPDAIGARRPRGASTAEDARATRCPIVTWLPSSRRSLFGNRKDAAERCPGNNGLCPGWIVDNFYDYSTRSGSTCC